MKFAQQDLVHPPQRLEHVQVVLAGLAVDVRGLAGQLGAGRVDALAALVAAPRSPASCASQSISRSGRAAAQLVGDRDVAPGVAEADRRRDEQRPPRPRAAAGPARARCRRRAGDALANSRSSRLTRTGSRACGSVARALERDQLAAGQLGDTRAPRANGTMRSSLAVRRRSDRAAAPRGRAPRRSPGRRAEIVADDRLDERLRRRLEPPGDAVLDLLGRVRLREALARRRTRGSRGSRAASSGGCTSPSPRRCRARRRSRARRAGRRSGQHRHRRADREQRRRRARGARRRAASAHSAPRDRPATHRRSVPVASSTASGVGDVLAPGVGRGVRRAGPSGRCRGRRT